jgi:hypothetical protein
LGDEVGVGEVRQVCVYERGHSDRTG